MKGYAGGPGNLRSHGSGWGLGFYSLFCIARGQRYLSGADKSFLGRRGVSLTTYHLLRPPAVCPTYYFIVYSSVHILLYT
jgi:hypothetical protein